MKLIQQVKEEKIHLFWFMRQFLSAEENLLLHGKSKVLEYPAKVHYTSNGKEETAAS